MKKFTKILSLSLVAVILIASLGACTPRGNGGVTTPEATTTEAPTTTNAPDTTTEAPNTTTEAPIVTTTEEPAATTTGAPVNTYQRKTYYFNDTADKIKITGRNNISDDGIAVNWSASGIEFNADCKGDVLMQISSTATTSKYSLFIDGTHNKDIYINQKTGNYTLAEGLAEGVHNFRLVKLTDAETVETFSRLTVSGLLEDRPADKELYIEFLGDSVTCGYGLGVMSGFGTPSKNNHDNDASKAWAYLLAERMNADYSIVSIGGIGVLGSTDRHQGRVMNDLYPYRFYKDTSVEYTTQRKADIVIIGLNTNDEGPGRVTEDMEEQYRANVEKMISDIKAVNGEDVTIVWISALMSKTTYIDTWVKTIFEEHGGKEAGFFAFNATFDYTDERIDSHPTASRQATNARLVSTYLNNLIEKYWQSK